MYESPESPPTPQLSPFFIIGVSLKLKKSIFEGTSLRNPTSLSIDHSHKSDTRLKSLLEICFTWMAPNRGISPSETLLNYKWLSDCHLMD